MDKNTILRLTIRDWVAGEEMLDIQTNLYFGGCRNASSRPDGSVEW